MAWDYDRSVDFVKNNAPRATWRGLLMPASRLYNTKYPNISIIWYSMPDWLYIFELGPRFSTRKFVAIDGEYRFVADRYQTKVAEALDLVASFATGQALLQEIAANSRHSVRIMPILHWKRVNLPGPTNATPRPLPAGETLAHVGDGTMSADADGYARGAPLRDDNSEPMGSQKGTGKGADVVLYYSPEFWREKHAADGPGFDADEVIFHEMVHVTRLLRGLLTLLPVTGGGNYRNEDEYLATLIANLYLSEKGKSLRGAYDDGGLSRVRKVEVGGQVKFRVIDPPPKDWAVMKAPDKFYQNPDKTSMSPRELVRRFGDTQKAFYLALARLPEGKPKFNPVRQHFQENQRPDI